MSKTIFERYPKVTLICLWTIFGLMSLFALELSARHYGLGDVVLYESSPIYGYRPAPNQTVARFGDAQIKLNNLGLRANQDWTTQKEEQRVLFLGDSVTYGGSYIDNAELFSQIAVHSLPFISGNAGVNGWGVSNLHALIKEKAFLPADIYVTVLPEGDFYRGLSRLGGQPYWTRPAKSALEELAFYGLYKLFLKKTPYTKLSQQDKKIAVEIAAKHLKEMDDYIKANGFEHIIIISPSRSQAISGHSKDMLVEDALTKVQLKPLYLLDYMPHSQQNIDALFHDEIHLTKAGHQQWGEWIEKELKTLQGKPIEFA